MMSAKKRKRGDKEKALMLGLPKGSLQEATFALFKKAGWSFHVDERSLNPAVDDPELSSLMFRAQEMAGYVEKGILDAGLTGRDWVVEQGAKVKEVCSLTYAKSSFRKVRWVVVVPNDSPIKKARDLNGKLIATEAVNMTRRYLRRNKIKAEVEFSWGATEIKPPLLADAIVELTETGSSLRAHNLRILDTVMESETVFISNRDSYKNKWKRNKIDTMALMLQGALEAGKKVGLKMNVARKKADKIFAILPAMHTPTIASLADPDWLSIEVVIDETEVRKLVPALRKAGATGIIEYPLNKVIP
jgi:ATP phosphoribosyltransferase